MQGISFLVLLGFHSQTDNVVQQTKKTVYIRQVYETRR